MCEIDWRFCERCVRLEHRLGSQLKIEQERGLCVREKLDFSNENKLKKILNGEINACDFQCRMFLLYLI